MPNDNTPQAIDVKAATEVTPKSAPVSRSLSGKEQAGVNLTWGVLVLIGIFLAVIILILWTNESRSAALSGQLLQASKDTAFMTAVETERAAFRTFWLEITRTILLNVLLPVLTALLGYVFGTTQTAANRTDN